MSHMILEKSGKNILSVRIQQKPDCPPPYHVYECLGEYFVFDTSTKALYNTNKIAYSMLKKCLTGVSILEARNQMLKEMTQDTQNINAVAQEIALLATNGLFECPDYTITDRYIDKCLERRYKDFGVSSLTVGMTESCNLACVYCYCRDRQESYNRSMSKETIKKTIDWHITNSGNNKKLSLCFFGGEPLMNKSGIAYAVEYGRSAAKKVNKEYFYTMTSNVSLADEETADFLKKNNIQVLVSHDGPKEIHDKQCPDRKGLGSFEQVSRGAKNIINRQKNVKVRNTMISPCPDINKLVNFYERFGFSGVHLGPAGNPEFSKSKYDFSEEDYFRFYKQMEMMLPDILEKLKNKHPVFYDPYWKFAAQLDPFKGVRKISVSNCGAAGAGGLYVNVDGKIYPCHHFYDMESWVIGDINKPLDINKLKQFWKRYTACLKNCKTCWAALICENACAANQMGKNGFFNEKVAFCNAKRYHLERVGYYYYHKESLLESNRS